MMKSLLQKTKRSHTAIIFFAIVQGTLLTGEALAKNNKLKVDDAKVIFCETIPAPTTGRVCDVTTAPQGSPSLLIKGNVLTVSEIFQGGEVLVDHTGLIKYVGCSDNRDPVLDSIAATATRIECAEGVISPGLINSHDHLGFNQNFPIAPSGDSNDRYDHRNDWREIADIPGDFSQPKITWSELRQAMIGTTSIAGGIGSPGVLRNLDQPNLNPSFYTFPLFDDLLWNIFQEPPIVIGLDTFPVEGANDFAQNDGDCANFPDHPNLAGAAALSNVYIPHGAEGVNSAAQNEFKCLSSTNNNGIDVVDDNLAMVHGIALDANDGKTLASEGAKLIWSPRSNMALYGNTAPVRMLKDQGVLLSLSTDWTATGSMHLGRELMCADELNTTYFDNAFSNRELWLMVTYNPAISLKVDNKIGSLAPGLFGDIAIYDGTGMEDPYRAVIEANANNMVLVFRRSSLPSPFPPFNGSHYIGAVALYGDTLAMQSLPPTFHDNVAPIPVPLCESIDVCNGVVPNKIICPLRETWWVGAVGVGFNPQPLSYNFLGLEPLDATNAGSYDLFLCDDPIDEPTCIPSRPNEYNGTIIPNNSPLKDSDGDGIYDSVDNCKKVFNPIRPMDGYMQADTDGDGRGDACDKCPLDTDTFCTAVDPYSGVTVYINDGD